MSQIESICWAKLRRDCVKHRGSACRERCACEVIGTLSLIGHAADVAAVFVALLERPVIARRLARLLGVTELGEELRAGLAVLAALHDIGKISLGFQQGPFIGQPNSPRGHVAPMLSLVMTAPHDIKARMAWRRLQQEGGLARLATLLLGEDGEAVPFRAALAHHGSLPGTAAVDPCLWQASRDHDPTVACRDLVEAVTGWFPAVPVDAALPWTFRFGHAFAGLLTLADWLGSDETVFPMVGMAGAPDGTARYAWALPRARDLLARRLLAPEAARAACAALRWEIEALTGFSTASAAQAAMLALPPPPEEGQLCLIEDETGSGKTEAALIHFLRLFQESAVDGMYFALPTRAAAVQIHGRIQRLLTRLLGDAAPAVILAVPGYLDKLQDTAALPDEASLWPEDSAADAHWASARPKRYLAACVAVGTIDQLLMGGLKIRHAQLRSSAMLRQLVAIDEVHSSDVYGTSVLRNLLDQHLRAGGHGLLMSATLGSAARRLLLTPGEKQPEVPMADAIAMPYPAVWTQGYSPQVSVAPSSGLRQKSVHAVLEPHWRDPTHAVSLAVQAGRQGARVLLLRNTVADVVATQLALEAVAPDLSLRLGAACAPHHARFAPEDRRLLDAALEAILGAGAPREGGCVIVTSQTAEQSLDIDADLLITDLCPADVLLQRIGRLHRRRGRIHVPGFEQARVIVLAPSEDELEAALDGAGNVRRAPLALGLVYPDLLGVVATRRTLAATPELAIPRDNRRLVEHATHPDVLAALANELGGNWSAHLGRMIGVRMAQGQEAEHARLDWDQPIQPITDLKGVIKTRLGLDSRWVDFPTGTPGPFGQMVTGITVPGHWGLGIETEAVVTAGEAGDIRLRIGEAELIYDRLGLRRR